MLKVFFLIFIYELFILLIFDLIKNMIINYKINKSINYMKNIDNLINKQTKDEEIEEAKKIIDSYKEV